MLGIASKERTVLATPEIWNALSSAREGSPMTFAFCIWVVINSYCPPLQIVDAVIESPLSICRLCDTFMLQSTPLNMCFLHFTL